MMQTTERPCTPFVAAPSDTSDADLVSRAQAGDGEALENLCAKHLFWIYNLSLRMLRLPADAEDATQEIFIKVLKALPAFRHESKFTTWLYRIAVNHLLNVKKANWAAVDSVCSFEHAAAGLHRVPDLDLPDPRTVPVPVEILVEETKLHCSIGTLLCLDGRQRLVFILGEIFGVSDEVGAEILEVTPANFRQILFRARRDLYEYLRGNCSLLSPDNHCKCSRKTRTFVQAGFVDPQKLQFTASHLKKVREVADARCEQWEAAYMEAGANVYRDHPFYEPAEQVEMLRRVLQTYSLQ